MPSPKTYLVSGSTRGIGRGLVSTFLARDNSIVIAGVRDPNAATAKALNDLPKGQNSQLIIVKINSLSETDANEAIQILKTQHSITGLNVVFANAGIAQENVYPASTVPLNDITSCFSTNVLGPVALYQATLPLLTAASGHFLVMSSLIGSTTSAAHFPPSWGVVGYGISKAAVNYFVSKASGEVPEGVKVTAVHPGLVDTEMGAIAVKFSGMEAISVETSVKGLVGLVEKGREETNGKFLQYDGEVLPW